MKGSVLKVVRVTTPIISICIDVVGVFFVRKKSVLVSNRLTKNVETVSEKKSFAEDPDKLPVVVIGSGPVGLRFIQALRKRNPKQEVILYGKEPWEPYNRVKLSLLLSGEANFSQLKNISYDENDNLLHCRFNCAVVKIDTLRKMVIDERGGCQPYKKLVLAMGSRAHIPGIMGVEQKGVYVFRDMDDAQSLLARQVRTRKVVVIGGGLLGLEAAKAMQRNNTEVTVVEHTPRLLNTQLDAEGSALLREHVMSLGIKVRLGESVHKILSNKFGVCAVKLSSNVEIDCDTVIISAGIRPNVEIAREAHIAVGKGIRVDDSMCTNVDNVYAIGECCEHRKRIYGLVAPGYEQAEVAAHAITKGKSKYKGSISSTNLKVIDKSVFSMGVVLNEGYDSSYTEYKYSDHSQGVYRKIIIKNKRIVGAISIGDWSEKNRIQSLIDNKNILFPWHIIRFKKGGILFSEEENSDIQNWPSSAVVCNCTGKTRGELSKEILSGCQTVECLSENTGAGTVCGSCKPLVINLLGSVASVEPVRLSKSITATSIALLLVFFAYLTFGSVGYNHTSEGTFQWDVLWRSSLAKQITGFSILGLSVIAVVLSFRKRVAKFTLGDFDVWRGIHIFASLFSLFALFAHTGFRIGNNLNAMLMVSFFAMLLVGSLSAIVIANTHKFDLSTMTSIRKKLVWGHIILFWPVPVLLMFHVLKSYYF